MSGGFRVPLSVPAAFLAPPLRPLAVFGPAPIAIALGGPLTGTKLTSETVFVGLANFVHLAGDPAFWRALEVTLLVELLLEPLQVVCAFALALPVLREGPLLPFFRTTLLVPMTVPIALTSLLRAIPLEPTSGPGNGLLRTLGLQPQPVFRSERQALPSLLLLAKPTRPPSPVSITAARSPSRASFS